MITFVVNLHPGIPSMVDAEPFLYPLQKADKLYLLFPATNSIEQRVQNAAMQVRKHLEHSDFTKWQVVFLVRINADQYSPFQDSLSAQMLLIRKLFLENESLNQTPSQCYIIALDHVNEDEAIPAINASKIYRDSWELDTTGYIRNSKRFFVSTDEINALDQIWKSKIHLSQSTIVNLGFSRLPFEIQEEVNNAIENITTQVDELLNAQKIRFSDYAVTNNINYIDEPLIDAIKKEFVHRLTTTKTDPSRYNNFSPTDTLKACIAEHLGIFATENQAQFKLLRFPVQYNHEDILQQYLLKLAVLISLIVEEENAIKSLTKRNYAVNIELNDAEIQTLMLKYYEHLHNTEKRISNRLNNPPTVQLSMLDEQDCSCNETLSHKQPNELNFDFLRSNGDLKKWQQWNKEVAIQLDEYSRQARKKMQSCIDRSHRKEAGATKHEVKDIEAKAEDIKRVKEDLQDRVEHDFLSKSFDYDWNAFQIQQAKKLKPKLFSRPTSNEIILMLFLSIIIMVLGFFNPYLIKEQPSYYALYYTFALIVSTVFCLIAFFLAKRSYQTKLHKFMLLVHNKARNLRSDINSEFERQKTYLKSLCQLGIVRYNYEQAENAKNERTNTNLLLDYHRRKLNEHKNMAQQMLRIFKANDHRSTTGLSEEPPEPDINKPTFENDVYSPTTFLPSALKDERKIVHIENTGHKVNNELSKLVNAINFDSDRIYTKNPKL